MRQRLAFAISILAAAGVLAVGLTAAGFAPQPRSDGGTVAEAADVEMPATEGTAARTDPEIVYIKPAPEPKTVVVKKRVQAPASSSRSTSTRAVRTTRASGDDDRYEREGSHEREHEDRYEDD
jgi:hypothetical protein